MKIKIFDVVGFILGVGLASPFLNSGKGTGWLIAGIVVFIAFIILARKTDKN